MFKRCKLVMLPSNEDFINQHLYVTSDDEIKDGNWYDDSYGNIRQVTTIKTEYSIAHRKMVTNVYYGKNINSYHTLHEQMKKIIATTNISLTKPKSFKYGNMIMEDINGDGSYYFAKDTVVEFGKPRSFFINLGLLLPQPSESFIQKYIKEFNKGNIITDVLVEYENTREYWKDRSRFDNIIVYSEEEAKQYNCIMDYYPIKIKTSKDNTITIKRVKDSWSRDEVIEYMQEAFQFGLIEDKLQLKKWIEQNLE